MYRSITLCVLAASVLAGCVGRSPVPTPDKPGIVIDGIDFGHDSGRWAKDNECDDPRFKGPGMTNTPLLAEDIRADATDCATAYRAGKLTRV